VVYLEADNEEGISSVGLAQALERVHVYELHESEAIVIPVEVVLATRFPVPEILASIPKNHQTAVQLKIDFHLAQVVQMNIQRTLAASGGPYTSPLVASTIAIMTHCDRNPNGSRNSVLQNSVPNS
jgi:hypothetical protein